MIDINKELMAAMAEKKNAIITKRDTIDIDIKLGVLKDLKTKIIEFQTSGSGKKCDASAELEILKRLIKQRQNSAEEYKKGGREDLAEREYKESMVLEKMLPELPNVAQIELCYSEWRQNVPSEATFPYITKKQMGLAIKEVSSKFELVDKALVSKVVKGFIIE